MHVVGIESCAGKGGGHFHLAVDALFAQHGDFRFRAAVDIGRGDVVLRVESQIGKQGGALVVDQQGKLAVGAFGVVAQALDLVAGFLPGFLQLNDGFVEQDLADSAVFRCAEYGIAVGFHVAGVDNPQTLVGIGSADCFNRHARRVRETAGIKCRFHRIVIRFSDLNHRAQFFVKQLG